MKEFDAGYILLGIFFFQCEFADANIRCKRM